MNRQVRVHRGEGKSGRTAQDRWSGFAGLAVDLRRLGQFLLLSVAGVSEGGRKLKDDWTFQFSNFSVSFLRCWEQTGSSPRPSPPSLGRRGARPGRAAEPRAARLPGAAAERGAPGATAGGRGRRTEGWTRPPALRPGRARGCGGSLGPAEQRRVPGRGRPASPARHPRPLGRR